MPGSFVEYCTATPWSNHPAPGIMVAAVLVLLRLIVMQSIDGFGIAKKATGL